MGRQTQVVTNGEMAGLTTSNFRGYKAIVFGDPHCSGSPPAILGSTVAAWAPAVTGNVLIYGESL